MTGYMHPDYIQSLSEFGMPRELPQCGGSVLIRPIPGFSCFDAMGCYPLFFCQDWSQLHLDLKTLENELVSLSLVTDPFGKFDLSSLSYCFDHVVPFKEHFIVDMRQSIDACVTEHHRRYIRKSLNYVTIELCEKTTEILDEWTKLYDYLIQKHLIKGITAFSTKVFSKQLSIPGLTAFRAMYDGQSVGMLLWYLQNDVAYYHLGSSSPRGYELHTSFALFSYAIKYFAEAGIRWLDLGAGAGIDGNGTDGLTRFKRGWSNGTRTVYLCGRIFNQEKYADIVRAKDITAAGYFPAYRKGEFG